MPSNSERKKDVRVYIRCHLAGVHGQDNGITSLAFQLGSHVLYRYDSSLGVWYGLGRQPANALTHPKHLVQGGFGSCVCAEPIARYGSQHRSAGIVGWCLERTYPSSKSRKLVADPESLDMKTTVPIEIPVARSFCAVIMGPMVFVVR